jgi:hypothetical protein
MAEKNAQPKVGPAPKLDQGRQLDRVRQICTSIPGTVEKVSHGAPTFFTLTRVFVMFANNHHDDGHVAVWIPAAPGVQTALIEEAAEILGDETLCPLCWPSAALGFFITAEHNHHSDKVEYWRREQADPAKCC